MANRIAVGLLLVGALVATALYWILGGESERGSGRLASGPEARVEEPARPKELLPPVPAPSGVDEGPARVAEPEAIELAEAGGEREHQHGELGDMVVRGRVVDSNGRGIGGASIQATSGDFAFRINTQEATSDDEGWFELEDIAPGSMRLFARASGFAPLSGKEVRVPDRTAADNRWEIDPMTLMRGAVLQGRVVAPSGAGVAGVKLFHLPPDRRGGIFFGGVLNRKPLAVTGPDGGFRIDELAVGPYRILAQTEEHPDLIAEGITEQIGQVVGGLLWELSPGTYISGRVLDIPAGDTTTYRVRGYPAESSGIFGHRSARTADVESDGSFRLLGLELDTPYTLQLTTSARFFGSSRSNEVQADSGSNGVLLYYKPEGAIAMRVVDAESGAPVEAFTIEAGVSFPRRLQDEVGRPKTFHPDGYVRYGGLRPNSKEDRVRFAIKAGGYAPFERLDIALQSGQELDLGTIYLEPVPVLVVTVFDPDQNPVAGAHVRLTKETPGSVTIERRIEIDDSGGDHSIEVGKGHRGVTDENGVAHVTSFPGELCSLQVNADGYAPFQLDGLQLTTRKRSEQEVFLNTGGKVVVTVLDANGEAMPGAKVAHRPPTPSSRGDLPFHPLEGGPARTSDDAGRVEFEFLQPGVHGFRISEGGGNAFMEGNDMAFTIAVPGAGGDEDWSEAQVVEGGVAELTLVAPPSGSLEGIVRESGKLLPGASLSLKKKKEDDSLGGLLGAHGGRMFGGMGGKRQRSDGKGAYAFEDVKVGEYTLTVTHPTRRMPMEFDVDVDEGRNLFNLDLPVAVIEGRITDESGAPLVGVRVAAELKPEDTGGVRRESFAIMIADDGGGDAIITEGAEPMGEYVYTDADGRYTLRGVTPDVELLVTAKGEGVQPGESEPVVVAPDEKKRGVDLQLAAGGSILVEAQLADGAPARMCMVQASFQGQSESPIPTKSSFITAGSTTLDGLKPGPWRVEVRRMEFGNANQEEPIVRDVTVRPGEEARADVRFN